jgi:nitroreductase
MDFQDILRHRKSAHAYDQGLVPREALDRALASVLLAPSAGFTQGNEFLVLDDPAVVAEFWTSTEDPNEPLTTGERLVLPPVLILPPSNRSA